MWSKIRKVLALAAGSAALVAVVAPAATAQASTRHSDFYVRTVAGQWVAQDRLTAAQINALDNETNCAPVQTAVVVSALTQAQWSGNVTIGYVNGSPLIPEGDATAAQLSAANYDQVGLTGIPSFLGPTGYSVSFAADGTPTYACLP